MPDPFLSLSMGDFSEQTVHMALKEIARHGALNLNFPILKEILLKKFVEELEHSDIASERYDEYLESIVHNWLSGFDEGSYMNILNQFDDTAVILFSSITDFIQSTCVFIDFTVDDYVENNTLFELFKRVLELLYDTPKMCYGADFGMYDESSSNSTMTRKDYLKKYQNKEYIYARLASFM
jgi:hypothetical protein